MRWLLPAVFHRTRTPLTVWFTAVWLLTSQTTWGEFKRSMQRQHVCSSLLLSASDGSVAASC